MDHRKRSGPKGVGGRRQKLKRADYEAAVRPPTGKRRPTPRPPVFRPPAPAARPVGPRKSNPPTFRPPAASAAAAAKPLPPPAAAKPAKAAPARPEAGRLLVDQYLDKAIERLLIPLEKRNSRRKDVFTAAMKSKTARLVVVESPKGCGGEQLACAWLARMRYTPVVRSIVMADGEMGCADLIRAAGGTSKKARENRVLVLTDLEQSRAKMLAELEAALDKIVVVVSDAFDKGLRGALYGDTRATVTLVTCSADELARAAERALPAGVVAGGYAKLKGEAMLCDGNMSALFSRIDGGISGTKMDKRFDLFSEATKALLSGKSGVLRYEGETARDTIWAATPVVAEAFSQRTNRDAANTLDALVAALDDHSLGDLVSHEGWRSGNGILNAYADDIATRTLCANRERAGLRRPMGNPKSFYKAMGREVRGFNAAKRHGFQAHPPPYMLLAGTAVREPSVVESLRRFEWVYTPVHGDPTTDAIAATAAAIAASPGWALGPSDKGVALIPPPPLNHPQEMAAWFGRRYPRATTFFAEPWWPGAWGAIMASMERECFRPDKHVKMIANAAVQIAADLPPPPSPDACAAGGKKETLDREFPSAMRSYLRKVSV